jgi:dihydrofolate reductase
MTCKHEGTIERMIAELKRISRALESITETQVFLASSLPESLTGLRQTSTNLHKTFVIGGASLYTESLLLSPSDPAFVDRILLTRILSPAFENCDVFMPEFQSVNDASGDREPWKRSSHQDLQDWVGFSVPEGVQEEKGIQYEFQMWTRGGDVI